MIHRRKAAFGRLSNYYNGESKILRGVLNGWSVSPIMSVRSDIPFTVTSSDYNLDGISGNDRPNRIPGLTLSTAHGARAEQVAEVVQYSDIL